MRIGRAAVCAVFAGWIGAGLAHNIALKAHTRECFHEELHKEDKMTVTFQVGDREFGGSGNLDIDFYVRPSGLHRRISLNPLPIRWLIVVFRVCDRSPTRPAPTKHKSTPSRQATTRSKPAGTGNTHTASATSIGPPTARKFPSTFTASSMFPSLRHRKIRSRMKVSLQFLPCVRDLRGHAC